MSPVEPGDALALLRCPHCGADLSRSERAVGCRAGHTFDVARQGYVSLLPGGAPVTTGDTAAMVSARAAFLGAGHYAAIAAAVAAEAEQALADRPGGGVVDVGAGTGYHLAHVLERLPERLGLALDASKYALRRAARAHPRMGAVACDAWRPLPVRSGAAALVLSVFAPRNGAEIRRMLRPGGALLVVTPTRVHLAELVAPLGLLTVDERKRERLDAALDAFVTPVRRRTCEVSLHLDHRDLVNVARMGPSARHTDAALIVERVAALPDPMPVTASVMLSVYRRDTQA